MYGEKASDKWNLQTKKTHDKITALQLSHIVDRKERRAYNKNLVVLNNKGKEKYKIAQWIVKEMMFH